MKLVLLFHHYEYKFQSSLQIMEVMAHGELMLRKSVRHCWSLRVMCHGGDAAGGKNYIFIRDGH